MWLRTSYWSCDSSTVLNLDTAARCSCVKEGCLGKVFLCKSHQIKVHFAYSHLTNCIWNVYSKNYQSFLAEPIECFKWYCTNLSCQNMYKDRKHRFSTHSKDFTNCHKFHWKHWNLFVSWFNGNVACSVNKFNWFMSPACSSLASP